MFFIALFKKIIKTLIAKVCRKVRSMQIEEGANYYFHKMLVSQTIINVLSQLTHQKTYEN